MPTEYTPTTEDVRDDYENGVWNDGIGRSGPEVSAEFDRWLREHDAEVLREAAEAFDTEVNLFDFKPSWGSNDRDQEILAFGKFVLDAVCDRADRLARGEA